MNPNERFAQLLDLFVAGHASPQEQDELFSMIASHDFDGELDLHIARKMEDDPQSPQADLPPHISQEIVRNIMSAEKNTAALIPIKNRKKYWWWAAAAVIIAGSSLFLFSKTGKAPAFQAQLKGKNIEWKNLSDTVQHITLDDGSSITLQPGSSLYYPDHFPDSIREVYMNGTAFFRISHNPERPFLVYGKHIITKVLGTSFLINTNRETGLEEVSVTTGKVQVSENNRTTETPSTLSPVIITPNQKVIYEPEKRLFAATLVEKPAPIPPRDLKKDSLPPVIRFQYEQQNLSAIFADLEKAYGIEIIPENTELEHCLFTGDVSNNDLFTQLKIICLATRSAYEINGTRILIKGQGCR